MNQAMQHALLSIHDMLDAAGIPREGLLSDRIGHILCAQNAVRHVHQPAPALQEELGRRLHAAMQAPGAWEDLTPARRAETCVVAVRFVQDAVRLAAQEVLH